MDPQMPSTSLPTAWGSTTVPDSTEPVSANLTRDLVKRLADPEFYAERCTAIEIKETHLSYIFLGAKTVYKMKKSVRRPFIDLSTVQARELNSLAELALNRRLARDVYLDVVPITRSKANELQLGGDGIAVDWLVKMRRLPAERMLDKLILSNTVTCHDLEQLCQTLVGFYRRSPTPNLTAEHYLHRLAARLKDEHDRLLRPELDMPTYDVKCLVHNLKEILRADRSLFEARVHQGAIVEGHGDLRPEHICLEDRCVIFDCLEFSHDLRVLDFAEELAYLCLESAHLGASDLGEHILEIYAGISHTPIPRIVRCFYACYRALLRARLCIWHLFDCPIDKHEHWRNQALNYLKTAAVTLGQIR